MSDPDEEKGAPQIVPDAPGGAAAERAAANDESRERRDAEHDDADGTDRSEDR